MRFTTVLAALALIAVPSAPDEITVTTVLAIQKWVTAVEDHVPGKRDAAVDMVAALTYDDRRQMNAGMGLFLTFLKGVPQTIKSTPEQRLAHLAAATRLIPGAEAFLKRAAVLHGDTAFKRELDDLKGAEPAARPTSPPDLPYSPLLSQRSLYLNRDGEILGDTLADWNWPFARSLLARLSPRPSDDPFVGTWYHATSAFMFQRGLYGEVLPHLQTAAMVLPDDARVLFDRGCYAELQGLPRSQVLLSDADVLALRAQRSGRSSLIRTPTPASRQLQLGILPENETNEEAERLFRRALRADPSFVEARVRLGRLLDVRKRHEEAASELATAIAAKPTGPLLFYAYLFAGRSAQGLGKIAEAGQHYRAASLLFPGAQSAQLALSQAALLESDVPAAQESIRRLDKSTTARDPWWSYHFGSGRDTDGLLREMWAQVAPPATKVQ
jgi:tetratricopeptide (TPR) repeat protein